MSEQIFEYVPAERLKDLLREYSEALGLPVFILGKNEEILLCHPEGAKPRRLIRKGLSLREAHIGDVAVPGGRKTAEPALDFIWQNLTRIVRMSYEIDNLSGEVARNYDELSILWELTSKLGAGLDVDRICKVLADEVMEICPSNHVSILLVAEMPSGPTKSGCMINPGDTSEQEPPKKVFFPKVSLGEDASAASMTTLSADSGMMGRVYKNMKAVAVNDVRKDERFQGFPYPARRLLVVPLSVEGSVIGAIIATDKLDGEDYYSTEIKLISSIATDCAVAIKKALLYDEIHEMLFNTAEAFSLAMEAKDPYTYGHSKRVSELSANIAKAIGLAPETIRRIRLAALLHDIGKLGTPEVILGKVSGLEPEEMDRMKEHPYAGARIVENIGRMREIAQWMCHHHEKYDGSGYPSGLKGDEIPLPSRIIALADFYDALTSERPYRKALGRDEAVRIMGESVGTHFDPAVFEHFLKATQ